MKLTPVNVHKSGHFVNFIDLLLPLLMSENLFLTWIGQESSRDEKLPSIVPSNDNRRQFNWFVFRSVTVFVLCADAWKGRRRNLLHFFSIVVPLRCGCEVVVIAIVIVIDVILSIVFVFFDFLPRTWNSIWLWNCDAKYCSPKHSGHSHPFTLQPTVKGVCVCARECHRLTVPSSTLLVRTHFTFASIVKPDATNEHTENDRMLCQIGEWHDDGIAIFAILVFFTCENRMKRHRQHAQNTLHFDTIFVRWSTDGIATLYFISCQIVLCCYFIVAFAAASSQPSRACTRTKPKWKKLLQKNFGVLFYSQLDKTTIRLTIYVVPTAERWKLDNIVNGKTKADEIRIENKENK